MDRTISVILRHIKFLMKNWDLPRILSLGKLLNLLRNKYLEKFKQSRFSFFIEERLCCKFK